MIIRIGKAEDNDFVVDDAYVSRYHAKLIRDENGTLFLEDANSTNGTFVNGDRIIRKKISASDVIKLGEQYTLNIREVLKYDNDYSEEFAALKEVYDSYIKEKIRIQSSNQFKTRLFQSLPFAFIAVAGVVIGFAGKGNHGVLIVSLLLGICTPTAGVYLGAKQSAKIPELLQNIANHFKIDYVCPKCGAFLGEIPWESLANKKQCPVSSCKAKWVRK
ncbi:MAG: FHA domain-containing protein [Tannerella sp.]|jgi:lipopolysaccharide export LptBFGC system permease protein LptF|nr:FHA domain-containing protein [Tannerella sp.]